MFKVFTWIVKKKKFTLYVSDIFVYNIQMSDILQDKEHHYKVPGVEPLWAEVSACMVWWWS